MNLRQSFHERSGWVQKHLDIDPLSGHLFVFSNRRPDRLKVLFWDDSGLGVCAKRLEQGTFAWPGGEKIAQPFRFEQLNALISGLKKVGERVRLRR